MWVVGVPAGRGKQPKGLLIPTENWICIWRANDEEKNKK
jgi:hypothetical protein